MFDIFKIFSVSLLKGSLFGLIASEIYLQLQDNTMNKDNKEE